jgi:6-phosphogluconolactonase/glucosamine-6-phosphate isomerase/deaminase
MFGGCGGLGLASRALCRGPHFQCACPLSLSGGTTPKRIYELLGTGVFGVSLDWRKLYLFWGDERCVPMDHHDSNFRTAREAFIVVRFDTASLGLGEDGHIASLRNQSARRAQRVGDVHHWGKARAAHFTDLSGPGIERRHSFCRVPVRKNGIFSRAFSQMT